MKKSFCLLLAAIMMISLCGCFGDNKNDDVRGEIIGGNTIKDEKEPGFSFGKTANNTYNNDFLGISCTLPAEWAFYTDKQILQLNNMVGDYLDEDVAELLEKATIIYDMYALNETEGSNMNINLEKLSAVQMISLDIKQTLEAQIDAIKSTYQNMGYTDINVEYQKIKVDGKEFDGLKITAKIQGIDFYASTFAFRKSNYLTNVAICSIQTDKTDTILSYFTVK